MFVSKSYIGSSGIFSVAAVNFLVNSVYKAKSLFQINTVTYHKYHQFQKRFHNLEQQVPLLLVIRHFSARDMLNYLPYFTSGKIAPGFGRGSKELGIPTANFPLEVVKSLPESFQTGVYYGWANVDNGPVYKMVMSIGWNPFYDNKEKSMETHILHNFNCDLYGSLLKICIVGYLRPEENFKSLEDLIACIKQDIAQAEEHLESNIDFNDLQNNQFFHDRNSENNDKNEKENK